MSSNQPYYDPPEQSHQSELYAPPPPMPTPVEPGRSQALAGLIVGIISLIVWFIPCVGLPVSIVGIIMSVIGRRSISHRAMATVGLVLSIIGLVVALVYNSLWVVSLSTPRY